MKKKCCHCDLSNVVAHCPFGLSDCRGQHLNQWSHYAGWTKQVLESAMEVLCLNEIDEAEKYLKKNLINK